MPGGGFVRLPGGSVVVALSLPRPGGRERSVRVLVHSVNRQRALTRLRNLGLHSVYLRGNTHPPTPDEVTAVLHHPDGLVWRATLEDDTESWHPIRHLLRPETAAPRCPAVLAARAHAADGTWWSSDRTRIPAGRTVPAGPAGPRLPRPVPAPAAERAPRAARLRWFGSAGQDDWLPREFRPGLT